MTYTVARALALDNRRWRGHLYNGEEGLRSWRASLAGVRSSGGIINVSALGDSITEGAFASGDRGLWTTMGFLGCLRSRLAAEFEDTGTGYIPTYFPFSFPIWTTTGTWSENTGFGSTGLHTTTSTVGDTAEMSFDGTGFAIVVVKGGVCGTFDVSIDGGAATTFDAANASTVRAHIFEVTGLSAGAHTATVTHTQAGKTLFLLGGYPLKGTDGVRVNMVGRYGTRSGEWLTSEALYAQFDVWSPSLSIINSLANEVTNGTTPAEYRSNIETLVDAALPFGSVLLTSVGLRDGFEDEQESLIAVLREVAVSKGCAFYDSFARWGGDFTTADSLGFMADAAVHPGAAGHQDIGSSLADVLLANA